MSFHIHQITSPCSTKAHYLISLIETRPYNKGDSLAIAVKCALSFTSEQHLNSECEHLTHFCRLENSLYLNVYVFKLNFLLL
jgi:hypothetical protein